MQIIVFFLFIDSFVLVLFYFTVRRSYMTFLHIQTNLFLYLLMNPLKMLTSGFHKACVIPQNEPYRSRQPVFFSKSLKKSKWECLDVVVVLFGYSRTSKKDPGSTTKQGGERIRTYLDIFFVFLYLQYFWRARVCWPLFFAYVAHFVFLREVWIRIQRAARIYRSINKWQILW